MPPLNPNPIEAVSKCNTTNGPIFVYDNDQVIGKSIRESGQFGEHIIDEVIYLLKQRFSFNPHTFIDIGANIGTHTLYAMLPSRFQQAIAIEADAKNFLLLKANIAIRGLQNRTQLIECALTNHVGEVELELCNSNFGDHRVRVNVESQLDLGESNRACVRVKAETADRILGSESPPWQSTLVWIDTQGHEGQIFQGGMTSLGINAPAIVIEFWPYGLEKAGGKKAYFDFLVECIEIYDLNITNWQQEKPISVEKLEHLYDQYLAATKIDFYPHTDLLCIRKAALKNITEEDISIQNRWAPMNEFQRTLMTIGCRDTDFISKVTGAGQAIKRGDVTLQRMHNGIEVLYGGYYGDWMAHIIRGLNGHHEPQEEAIFHTLMRYIRHKSTIVELGCFWAYYTQWFLKEIPDSVALCIEPDKHNLEVGKQNTIINGHSERVRFINAWIGGESKPKHEAPTETEVTPIPIPMMNAPDVLTEAQTHVIELLHMDIQGAELAFLKTISLKMAREKLRFIMVSTHHSCISGSTTTHSDCLEALRNLGATILVEHDVIESYSGDGLILASMFQDDQNLWFPTISRNRAETSLFKRA